MRKARLRELRWTLALLIAAVVCALGQSQQQTLPDAPSPQTLPDAPRPQKTGTDAQPAGESSSRDSAPAPAVQPRVDESGLPASGNPAPPMTDKPAVSPVTPLGNPTTPDTTELYKISTNVNFIEIPVTVKDSSGRMVPGLLPKDFSVYENGVRQKLTYFTSDPLPLSAAVLIDVSMSDTALRKVQAGLQAIQGAFSVYDEVEVLTYGNAVTKESNFSTAGDRLTAALNKVIETKHGETYGPPINGGPFEAGPTVNGHPADPSVPHVPIVPRDRRVLNDAILQAALDLSKVAPARRRVVMVIGDGREDGSRASYADVLKVLLTNKITVYAIGVGSAAIPVYRRLEQINIPGTGNANILHKYTNATGGEAFSEFSQQAIENAYSAATVEARNQYTLGYYTQATLAENYRDIEVRVDRGGLRVTAKAGYYPLPLPPNRQ